MGLFVTAKIEQVENGYCVIGLHIFYMFDVYTALTDVSMNIIMHQCLTKKKKKRPWWLLEAAFTQEA